MSGVPPHGDVPGSVYALVRGPAAAILAAIRLGAAVYVLNDATPERIHETVRRILADRRERASRPLTPRELEVLHRVVVGLTDSEIARELEISVGTVRSHVQHILVKVGALDRSQAAIRARDLGLDLGMATSGREQA